jgi:hypothetical protein
MSVWLRVDQQVEFSLNIVSCVILSTAWDLAEDISELWYLYTIPFTIKPSYTETPRDPYRSIYDSYYKSEFHTVYVRCTIKFLICFVSFISFPNRPLQYSAHVLLAVGRNFSHWLLMTGVFFSYKIHEAQYGTKLCEHKTINVQVNYFPLNSCCSFLLPCWTFSVHYSTGIF